MKYYIEVIKKYAVFTGRASRKEYWMFVFYNFIVMFIAGIFAGLFSSSLNVNLNFLKTIYFLFIVTPALAVTVRRIQDSNTSGWFILVPIYSLILLFLEGTEGDNKYGPNPNKSQFY